MTRLERVQAKLRAALKREECRLLVVPTSAVLAPNMRRIFYRSELFVGEFKTADLAAEFTTSQNNPSYRIQTKDCAQP